MRTIKTFIFLFLFFIKWITPTYAQYSEFIGDTIEFDINGYKEGTIQWQFSPDKHNWENIPNANSEKFVYIIKKTGYFRANIKVGNCAYFSELQEISATKVKRYFIAPQSTDTSINNWLTPHYVTCNKNIKEEPELVLYFTGTTGKPSDVCFFIDSLTQNSSNVISLSYPNSISPWSFCQSKNDECFETFRREVLWGYADTIKKVQDVSKANSVYNRLSKLLEFLSMQHPDQGWNNFIANGEIDWSKIIVSGWSQGGGLSLFISKHYSVKRVVMFSAPSDYLLSTKTPASWLSKSGKTNNSKIYGFATKTEDTVPIEVIIKNWDKVPLPGDLEIINSDTKLSNQHKLLIETGNHGTPNFDLKYSKVWKYLFSVSAK